MNLIKFKKKKQTRERLNLKLINDANVIINIELLKEPEKRYKMAVKRSHHTERSEEEDIYHKKKHLY